MGERAIALFDEGAIALLNRRYTRMDADGERAIALFDERSIALLNRRCTRMDADGERAILYGIATDRTL